jgi:DNA-binding GntR family transcriptional regulator
MPLPDSAIRIPRASARSAVLEQLRGWVEDGILEPGEVVKDSDIAERLGVSRTPVREALQILEQQGIIESVPGRYTRVSTATLEDARLVYPPLSVLQALAAEVAAKDITAADLSAMEAENERLIAAVRAGDALAARDADTAFHRIIVERTGNAYLASAVEHLLIHVRRLEVLFFRHVGPARESHDQHAAIIDALRRGDSATAAALTRENFLRFWQPPTGEE